jgi:hypothetical protein
LRGGLIGHVYGCLESITLLLLRDDGVIGCLSQPVAAG